MRNQEPPYLFIETLKSLAVVVVWHPYVASYLLSLRLFWSSYQRINASSLHNVLYADTLVPSRIMIELVFDNLMWCISLPVSGVVLRWLWINDLITDACIVFARSYTILVLQPMYQNRFLIGLNPLSKSVDINP